MASALRSAATRWTVSLPLLALLALVLTWGSHPGTPVLIVVGLLLAAAVLASVHHAEVVAHRVGEPFGSLVLAVAIAAATVTFSVVDAVVLKPLPFDRPDQLVQITGRNLRGPYPLRTEQFWPIHDGVPAFEHVAGFTRWTDKLPVIVDGTTEQLIVMRSTAELFQVLRLVPVLGRVWGSDEETRGDRVAVISFRFWQRRFSGDPSVVGRTIRIGRAPFKIIGVFAPQFGPRRGLFFGFSKSI